MMSGLQLGGQCGDFQLTALEGCRSSREHRDLSVFGLLWKAHCWTSLDGNIVRDGVRGVGRSQVMDVAFSLGCRCHPLGWVAENLEQGGLCPPGCRGPLG